MTPVVFLRSAQADIRHEKSHYRKIDPNLARRFAASLESSSRAISENPLAMEELMFHVRRWPVKGFPHGILYRVEPNRVVVLSVFHPKQNPSKWKTLASS